MWHIAEPFLQTIRRTSPGPVFYAQERVGMNGRRFRMIKFRSMRRDAEKDRGNGARNIDPGVAADLRREIVATDRSFALGPQLLRFDFLRVSVLRFRLLRHDARALILTAQRNDPTCPLSRR